MDYAGDDYVILEGERAHCLYSTAKLDVTSLDLLPGLRGAVVEFRRGTEHKAVLDLHRQRPEQVRSALPVDAIVVPSVAGATRPRLRRAGAAEALRALAPTTLLQLPGAAQARMTAMAELVKRVPVFGLELAAGDMTGVAELVASVCADPVGASGTARSAG
jgi:hypothetical protein